MTTDRNTPEAVAFRAAYQILVDRSPVAPDTLMQTIGTRRAVDPPPSNRRRVVTGRLVSLAVVALTLLGVMWLRPPSSVTTAPARVERIALGDASEVLGGEAVVVSANVATFDIDFSDVRMWVWSAPSGPGEDMVLIDLDQNQTDVGLLIGALPSGSEPRPPTAGTFETFEIPDREWTAISWTYGDRWRILATGSDVDGGLAALAATIGSDDPSSAGIATEYSGNQLLYPPAGTSLYELFYDSPAGRFSLVFYDGFDGVEAARFGRFMTDVVSVGESAGIVIDDGSGPNLLWNVGANQTAGLDLEQLPLDTGLLVAEKVIPITAEEWTTLARVVATTAVATTAAQSDHAEPARVSVHCEPETPDDSTVGCLNVVDGTEAEFISPWHGPAGSVIVELTFAEPTVIDAIDWSNIDDQTLFPLHHRARSLTIQSDDSPIPLVVELADSPGTQRIGYAAIRASTLRITVTSTWPSESVDGAEPLEELSIEEIAVVGHPAP